MYLKTFLFLAVILAYTVTIAANAQIDATDSLWNKPSDQPPQTGEVSFNGQANTQKCKSATNLGEIVKQEDEKYVKRVCVTNPGQAKDRCFMEEKGAKEPVENGDQLISTGQNSGRGSRPKEIRKLVKTISGFSFKNLPLSKFNKDTKPEMQELAPKSCCTRFGTLPDGRKICIETVGTPVKQFGQLKGGNSGGNKSKPFQAHAGPKRNQPALEAIREALSI